MTSVVQSSRLDKEGGERERERERERRGERERERERDERERERERSATDGGSEICLKCQLRTNLSSSYIKDHPGQN